MASQPVYNGSARVSADNGQAPALLNRFVMRASVATIATTDEEVANATFQAEAGTGITINYDIRKTGAGAEVDTPTRARIRIFTDDNSNDARTGAELESADLIGGTALPKTGTVTFTPTQSGTYRIQVEMEKGNGDFGATAADWRAISDGLFSRGGLATITQALNRAKGRLRYGHRVSTITVTERGSAAPALFAFTRLESVRIEATFSAAQRLTTATEVYSFRQRRNGTSTFDVTTNSTRQSTTLHRSETLVGLVSYPQNNTAQTYDSVIEVANNSALHTGNTPQYTGLTGADASGAWVHFVNDGTNFLDFRTAQKLSSHTVNPGGQIETIFAKRSDFYSETAGVPNGSEDSDFVATADNMTVKAGRVLNARNEAVSGVFVSIFVVHESSGSSRSSWGIDDANFLTLANGWQTTANVVTVSTPPSGIHKIDATAYFPSGSFGTPALRQFSQQRVEQGSPAGVNAGKNWIAPASFFVGVVAAPPVVQSGATVPFSLYVFDRSTLKDADITPTVKVYKNRDATPFATPLLTRRSTGIYDGTFAASPVGAAPDTYEVMATAIVNSFEKTFGNSLEAVAVNPHESYSVDAIDLALNGTVSLR